MHGSGHFKRWYFDHFLGCSKACINFPLTETHVRMFQSWIIPFLYVLHVNLMRLTCVSCWFNPQVPADFNVKISAKACRVPYLPHCCSYRQAINKQFSVLWLWSKRTRFSMKTRGVEVQFKYPIPAVLLLLTLTYSLLSSSLKSSREPSNCIYTSYVLSGAFPCCFFIAVAISGYVQVYIIFQ